jgi:hypothetical protein
MTLGKQCCYEHSTNFLCLACCTLLETLSWVWHPNEAVPVRLTISYEAQEAEAAANIQGDSCLDQETNSLKAMLISRLYAITSACTHTLPDFGVPYHTTEQVQHATGANVLQYNLTNPGAMAQRARYAGNIHIAFIVSLHAVSLRVDHGAPQPATT